MLILLIGPKGSGKSHIGRILEARFGAHFFHVEPLWKAYYEECKASSREPVIAEGIAKVHPVLVRALDKHAHVCVRQPAHRQRSWRLCSRLGPAERPSSHGYRHLWRSVCGESLAVIRLIRFPWKRKRFAKFMA